MDVNGRQSAHETDDSDAAPVLPKRIGDYRVVRLLGFGGMGVVYEAEQQHPRRPVALKVIRGGRFVDDNLVRMFRREGQALARLRHPGIAAIYESGRTEDGQHFFAMELVRGVTLTEHVASTPPPAGRADDWLGHRLALFRKVCDSVNYAHQRGVVHRDLKPTNILVLRSADTGGGTGRAPAAPGVKILDFGLARITDTDIAVSTIITDLGRVQGTLPYMSPEQLRGNPDELDLRTDIYSLGVILYEMLTGDLPYDVSGLPLPDAIRVIGERSPRSPRRLAGFRLDRDLETVMLKALEKEPDRRYQSAGALSDDVGRYLTQQPILARPASPLYQLRKMVSRHRAGFGFAATLLLLLVGFAVTMAVQAGRIAREAARAEQEAARAEQEAEAAREVSNFLEGLFAVADPGEARGTMITAHEILQRGTQKIERELADQPLTQARLMATIGKVHQNLGLYDEAGQLFLTSLELRERALGPDHPEVADGLSLLGRVRQLQGRYTEARELHERALEIRTASLGPEHLDTGWSYYHLGALSSMTAAFSEGEERLRRALSIFERELGPDSIPVAWCWNDLGIVAEQTGELEQARRHYGRALMIKERLLGQDHFDVVMGMNNLGYILVLLGEYEEAESLLRRALETSERVLGARHRISTHTMNSLGSLLHRMGRSQEAVAILERAVSLQAESIGEDHPDYAMTLNSLAAAKRDLQQYGEAERLFRRSLEIRELVLGDEHPEVAETLDGYASLLRATGRADEADQLEARARAIRARRAQAEEAD